MAFPTGFEDRKHLGKGGQIIKPNPLSLNASTSWINSSGRLVFRLIFSAVERRHNCEILWTLSDKEIINRHTCKPERGLFILKSFHLFSYREKAKGEKRFEIVKVSVDFFLMEEKWDIWTQLRVKSEIQNSSKKIIIK